MRQAYLANGGNDPNVLSQMSQMQADAQAIEDEMKKEPPKPKGRLVLFNLDPCLTHIVIQV